MRTLQSQSTGPKPSTSGSEDAEALKLHVSPLQAKVNDATGGALAPTITVWLWVPSR